MALRQSLIRNDTKSVFVFGSGTFASQIVSALQEVKIEILGVLDKQEFAGKLVGGFPVKSVEDYNGISSPVFIAVHNSFARIVEIEALLRAQGFGVTYTPPQIASFLGGLGKPIENYWLASSTVYSEDFEEYSEFGSMLSDQQSKDLLHDQLNYRKTGLTKFLGIQSKIEEQYFPLDVPGFFTTLQEMNAFVDLGAFQGDTLEALGNSKLRPKIYVGFEPDIDNFKMLFEKSVSFLGDKLMFPFAAFSNIDTLELTSAGPSSSISRGGGTMVQAAPLDILISGLKVSYIKMDIEGSEGEAIFGSKRLIARDKPVLAISIYHKPDDMVKLPQMINSFGVYDKFYLRCYGDQTFDTVLYCLPG